MKPERNYTMRPWLHSSCRLTVLQFSGRAVEELAQRVLGRIFSAMGQNANNHVEKHKQVPPSVQPLQCRPTVGLTVCTELGLGLRAIWLLTDVSKRVPTHVGENFDQHIDWNFQQFGDQGRSDLGHNVNFAEHLGNTAFEDFLHQHESVQSRQPSGNMRQTYGEELCKASLLVWQRVQLTANGIELYMLCFHHSFHLFLETSHGCG